MQRRRGKSNSYSLSDAAVRGLRASPAAGAADFFGGASVLGPGAGVGTTVGVGGRRAGLLAEAGAGSAGAFEAAGGAGAGCGCSKARAGQSQDPSNGKQSFNGDPNKQQQKKQKGFGGGC